MGMGLIPDRDLVRRSHDVGLLRTGAVCSVMVLLQWFGCMAGRFPAQLVGFGSSLHLSQRPCGRKTCAELHELGRRARRGADCLWRCKDCVGWRQKEAARRLCPVPCWSLRLGRSPSAHTRSRMHTQIGQLNRAAEQMEKCSNRQ